MRHLALETELPDTDHLSEHVVWGISRNARRLLQSNVTRRQRLAAQMAHVKRVMDPSASY